MRRDGKGGQQKEGSWRWQEQEQEQEEQRKQEQAQEQERRQRPAPAPAPAPAEPRSRRCHSSAFTLLGGVETRMEQGRDCAHAGRPPPTAHLPPSALAPAERQAAYRRRHAWPP